MSDNSMDGSDKFFLGVWSVAGFTFVAVVTIIAMYNANLNTKYYDSWNRCVLVGGQPMEQAVVGSAAHELTCVRK